MGYFQTWKYVARVKSLPIVGHLTCSGVQCLCGAICGHEISKTEFGYGGGDFADCWCRWCNKLIVVPKSVIQFRGQEQRDLMSLIEKT